jgi:hypothetical protein
MQNDSRASGRSYDCGAGAHDEGIFASVVGMTDRDAMRRRGRCDLHAALAHRRNETGQFDRIFTLDAAGQQERAALFGIGAAIENQSHGCASVVETEWTGALFAPADGSDEFTKAKCSFIHTDEFTGYESRNKRR